MPKYNIGINRLGLMVQGVGFRISRLDPPSIGFRVDVGFGD